MIKPEHLRSNGTISALQSRRDFLMRLGAASGVAGTWPLEGGEAAAIEYTPSPASAKARLATLFPTDLPELQWLEFSAVGFQHPVSGALFRDSKPPCCGVPIGGLDTGCLDMDVRGVYGFSSIFNPVSPCGAVKGWRMPRKPQDMEPILGLSVGGKTWVLASAEIIQGGDVSVCQEPFFGKAAFASNVARIPKLESVAPAKKIHYWGHYPVADLEFETDAPISVGLRAWAPFLPGDTAASNIPAAIFEVHLRNISAQSQTGEVAFNFPGPNEQEADAAEFNRRQIEEDFHGVMVSSEGGVNYVLGVLGDEKPQMGSGLNKNLGAWARIGRELPQPAYRESMGVRLYQDSGCSAAVGFSLAADEEKVIRFLLAWYAPVWEGARKQFVGEYNAKNGGKNPARWLGSKWAGDTNFYTHMYAARYDSSLDVARRMAVEHQSLLGRVLAWQAVVYGDPTLPVWLRDSLVNNLNMITETGVWAQAKPPLDDWAYPGGVYGLIESPRGDPDIACIPCDWYGNIPVVYFFPELAVSTLRAYKVMQREDGAAPFWVGILGDVPDFATPAYDWQISLNGTCYVDLVDRVWQRTGDDAVLREFYDSVKKCNTMTMNLRRGPGGVISMPEGNKGMEWFERGEWLGMCAHLGGLHLAQLRMMERMARHMGDEEYTKQCQAWLADGIRAMEDDLWAGSYYLNFYEKETGKKSDDVMGYQLDGQWAALFHGTEGVFRAERVETTLETIKRCNIALAPNVGAVNFARPDGSALPSTAKVADYGVYAMFPSELIVLAMTYLYAGQKEFGLDLARRHWENNALRQLHPWDMPNIVRGDTGERVYGTDYYQDMILWAIPAALEGGSLADARKPNGLINRMIEAAQR